MPNSVNFILKSLWLEQNTSVNRWSAPLNHIHNAVDRMSVAWRRDGGAVDFKRLLLYAQNEQWNKGHHSAVTCYSQAPSPPAHPRTCTHAHTRTLACHVCACYAIV